jgi:hypothetical protein
VVGVARTIYTSFKNRNMKVITKMSTAERLPRSAGQMQAICDGLDLEIELADTPEKIVLPADNSKLRTVEPAQPSWKPFVMPSRKKLRSRIENPRRQPHRNAG